MAYGFPISSFREIRRTDRGFSDWTLFYYACPSEHWCYLRSMTLPWAQQRSLRTSGPLIQQRESVHVLRHTAPCQSLWNSAVTIGTSKFSDHRRRKQQTDKIFCTKNILVFKLTPALPVPQNHYPHPVGENSSQGCSRYQPSEHRLADTAVLPL